MAITVKSTWLSLCEYKRRDKPISLQMVKRKKYSRISLIRKVKAEMPEFDLNKQGQVSQPPRLAVPQDDLYLRHVTLYGNQIN